MIESRKSKIRIFLKKYWNVINYRTLISVIISIVATAMAYHYQLYFNLDLTLISVAVVFPLVFTLGSAFQRREKALEHLGRAKGALSAILFCFSFAKKLPQPDKEQIYELIKEIKRQLVAFLLSKNNDKTALNKSIENIQIFMTEKQDLLGRSLALKVYRLMRDVIMGIENSVAIKIHETPRSVRAYCELFIYVFPFFYAPTLIYHIGIYDEQVIGPGHQEGISHLDNPFTFLVFMLNMVLSFFLITLYNIQEQIEDPFDQDGLDDIHLKNYLLDF